MLIISRKKDQKLVIADGIEITILEVGRNRVRFGINAPKDVTIQTRLKESIPGAPVTPPVEVQREPVVVSAEIAPATPARRFSRAF